MANESGIERRSAADFGETRSVSVDGRRLVGYPIVFNKLSKDFGGGVREVIHPEAVARTLNSGDDVFGLVDHNIEKVLARRHAGTLRMSVDSRGLRIEIDPIPKTQAAQDMLENMGLGNVSGMSFAFRAMPGGRTVTHDGDQTTIHVTDMTFREVSVVAAPMYLDTSIALRSVQEFEESHRGRHSLEWLKRWHKTQLAR